LAVFGPGSVEYEKRRDYVVGRLNAMPGVTCEVPEGAFYVFPNISGVGLTSKEFQHRLLWENHVVALPGTDFGAVGEGHVRYSYVRSMERLIAGMDKTEELVHRIMAEKSS
jgi:aspartate/methionine/tyrosine aminotransferase